MTLTEIVDRSAKEEQRDRRDYRRWLARITGVGFPVAAYLFSLYAPPLIRRALGRE